MNNEQKTGQFFAALKNNDAKRLAALLQSDPDLAKERWASRWDDWTKILCGAALSADAMDFGKTPLMLAATKGLAEAVAVLLPVSDPADWDGQGNTALACAACAGSEECVRLLLPVSDPNAGEPGRGGVLRRAFHAKRLDALRLVLADARLTAETAGAALDAHPQPGSADLWPLLAERAGPLAAAARFETLAREETLCDLRAREWRLSALELSYENQESEARIEALDRLAPWAPQQAAQETLSFLSQFMEPADRCPRLLARIEADQIAQAANSSLSNEATGGERKEGSAASPKGRSAPRL